jgi:hypothetical protein
LSPAQSPGSPWHHRVPRAPLHDRGVTSVVAVSCTASVGVTPPSSLIRAHASNQNPPATLGSCLGRPVFAGCCQPLLGDGPSRRYLCGSFAGCLGLYPGGPRGAHTRCFPRGIGLPHPVPVGRRTQLLHPKQLHVVSDFGAVTIRYSFRPPASLATLTAPTLVTSTVRRWLLHPSRTLFVTSKRIGHARRPKRVIDDVRTLTSQNPQPCRLLQREREREEGAVQPVGGPPGSDRVEACDA